MRQKVYNKKIYLAIIFFLFALNLFAQTFEFANGNWYINNKFKKLKVYSINGNFSFTKPAKVDSSIDLENRYCIPPFGDAHTHNFDGTFRLKELVADYIKDGIFYVQVLGNNGKNAELVRPILKKNDLIDITYANGLLTCTYGHGFYPYEPLAMNIYAPYLQIKYQDSVKKSRILENQSYYFLDTLKDVDEKWPLIIKYKPDHIKICILDALEYNKKRKSEVVDNNGLSPQVAAYVVQKAHAEGLRVFAHVETIEDFRLCAKIGVDVLAHLPGYGWDGNENTRSKYCMTKADIELCKKQNIKVIPTICYDAITKFDAGGNATYQYGNYLRKVDYLRKTLQSLQKHKVFMAIGADYFGQTTKPEIDSILKYKIFSNKQLLDLYSIATPKLIYPNRKIAQIAQDYEASFLVLGKNPLVDISAIKEIVLRVRKGKIIRTK